MVSSFQPARAPGRAVLLALCLLSACAAADPGDSAGPASRPISGASGAILTGRFAFGRADVDTAADDFLRALQSDPGDAELRQEAFTAAVMAGRPQALGLARQMPSNPAAVLLLATMDVKTGDWHAAEARFAALPDQGAMAVLRPLLQAWALQGAGATEQALATLRPLVEGARSRGVFALHAALINDQAGRRAEAARLYRLAMAENRSLDLESGALEASWQARSGQATEARATIHAMVDANPDLSIAEPALLQSAAIPRVVNAADGVAEAYLGVASALHQRQDASGLSLLLLRLALALRADLTAARLLSADLEASSRQWDAATAVLAAVAPADPLIALVQLRQADYLEHQGRTAQAKRQLDGMADRYPSRPEPLAALAAIQNANGQFDGAAATYGRAIARLGQPGRLDWMLFYEQGMSYDRAHDWPRAEADFLHALELSPDQPYVLNYLGYAWTEQGRNLTRAQQMLERAVAQQPNDGSIVDSLGWALLRQGDHVGAVHMLERAVELSPEDSAINGHLGDAYLAAGRRQEAETQWRRALVLNPEPQDEKALQAKLDDAGASATAARRVE